MILLITIPLALVISLAWYLPAIKAQGNNQVLTRKDYLVIALKYGFCFTCLLIILTEIIWDSGLDIGAYCLNIENSTIAQIFGIVLIMAMVIFGVVYCIKTVRKACAIAKTEPVMESQNTGE